MPSSISSGSRVYLDVCALCRPFDDQMQMRIRLETDAVQLVLSHIRSGRLIMMVSPVHDIELSAIPDLAEREHVLSILQDFGCRISGDLSRTRQRAEMLVQQRLGAADAAHLAFAEEAQADFITCDDRMLRRCHRIKPTVWCGTPIAFCTKENLR